MRARRGWESSCVSISREVLPLPLSLARPDALRDLRPLPELDADPLLCARLRGHDELLQRRELVRLPLHEVLEGTRPPHRRREEGRVNHKF